MKIRPLLVLVMSLALQGTVGAIHAAGEPILTKNIKGWGKVIDPKGDCSIEENDGTVSMTVVGWHDLSVQWGHMSAPRVTREIEGDFIAIVKVEGAFRAAGPSTSHAARPYTGAGLLLWQDERNYFRVELASVEADGQVFDYLSFSEHKNGEFKTIYNQIALKSEAARVRLERRNGKIYGAVSYDMRQWVGYPPLETNIPAKLQIGVAAISTSALPFIPEFSEFEVYRRETDVAPKAEKE